MPPQTVTGIGITRYYFLPLVGASLIQGRLSWGTIAPPGLGPIVDRGGWWQEAGSRWAGFIQSSLPIRYLCNRMPD